MSATSDHAEAAASAAESVPAESSVLTEGARLAAALRRWLTAQRQLLGAELGLARSALMWWLASTLAAVVFAVALGLTLLGLLAVLLAAWLHSWVAALAVLALVQIVLLAAAIMLFRRCLRWMSLPATRSEWRATWQAATTKAPDAGTASTRGDDT